MLAACFALTACTRSTAALSISTFSADVTVPIGHGMMGGSWLSKIVSDPLEAHGIVLYGEGKPVVFVSVDWCEIRNEAYFQWQQQISEALGTTPERVMISTVHQHDAPVADLVAEKILRDRKLQGTVCDPEFHRRAVEKVAAAALDSRGRAVPLTHLGLGQAKVEKVGSSRRYVTDDGAIHHDRMSRSTNPIHKAAEDGPIDPWLKTLSFWNGDQPIAALSFYAVHPMSYYGRGDVSADFPGIARRKRQQETPGVEQIYISGCSGNVAAGKYNDGATQTRAILAGRLRDAMSAAWDARKRVPVTGFTVRNVPVDLQPREGPGFTPEDLEAQLVPESKPFKQCLAAMGLSWRKRLDSGKPITIPALDFGPAQLILLPGESYVEYQHAAQKMRPESFVCVAGYGDGATGYIPTEQYVTERDSNLTDWCWVAPGAEPKMLGAIRQALGAK